MIVANRRSVLLGSLSAGLAPVLGLSTARPAFAHHGWNTFDTRRAYFAAGPVTHVRWGNPHGEVHISVARTALPANWKARELPVGANEADARETIASARPYRGEHKVLQLVTAGPEWMARWGLNRPLQVGETIEVVGFLASADAQSLRPVMFWLANGQGVWQQLTSFPRRPEPAN